MKKFYKYISFNFAISTVILFFIIWDAAKSISQKKINITSFGEIWYEINVQTLLLAQSVTQRYISEILWDPFIQNFLTLPIWVILIILLFLFNIFIYFKRKISHHLFSKQQ